jgi:peptidoglycan/LPS O-acetylase OafA/YrhL
VLIVATLLTWLGAYGPPLPLDPGLVFMQFAHLANYAIVKAGWYLGRSPESWVYWSLAVEEHFYLVLPVAYLAMLKAGLPPRRQAAIFLAVCLLTAAVALRARVRLRCAQGADVRRDRHADRLDRVRLRARGRLQPGARRPAVRRTLAQALLVSCSAWWSSS